MTNKEFNRKCEFYLPFFEYLVRDFPSAPLYDVIVLFKDGSSRHYFTFSRCPNIFGSESIIISVVSIGLFDYYRSRFCSFLRYCSKKQRNSLIRYYSTVLGLDEHSPSMISFNSLLSSLDVQKKSNK